MAAPQTIAQARSSAQRLVALANELASIGNLAAAEICAGGSLSLLALVAELAPPPTPPPKRKVK
ncbi:MAG: hypothetical protein ACJ8GN_02140 [Longimicrobiaceae bacterium]